MSNGRRSHDKFAHRDHDGYITEYQAMRLLRIAQIEASTHGWKPKPYIPPVDPDDDDDSPAFVYFCQATVGGPIKIGVARSPKLRLAALQSGSPLPLRMLAVMDGGTALENKLHRRFKDWRLHGEWFDENADGLAELIAEANEHLRVRAAELAARRALLPPQPKPKSLVERFREKQEIEWRG